MIFPDEKTLEENHIKHFGFREDASDKEHWDYTLGGYREGVRDAVNRIKSASSEGCEEWLKNLSNSSAISAWMISADMPNGIARTVWRAAVISTAAKYEEKLRELQSDYELGKQLSHEDMFRLLKHHQKSAEINLNEATLFKEKLREKDEENKKLKIESLHFASELNVRNNQAHYLQAENEQLKEAVLKIICATTDFDKAEDIIGDDLIAKISKGE